MVDLNSLVAGVVVISSMYFMYKCFTKIPNELARLAGEYTKAYIVAVQERARLTPLFKDMPEEELSVILDKVAPLPDGLKI